jgi:hypothetical protein
MIIHIGELIQFQLTLRNIIRVTSQRTLDVGVEFAIILTATPFTPTTGTVNYLEPHVAITLY